MRLKYSRICTLHCNSMHSIHSIASTASASNRRRYDNHVSTPVVVRAHQMWTRAYKTISESHSWTLFPNQPINSLASEQLSLGAQTTTTSQPCLPVNVRTLVIRDRQANSQAKPITKLPFYPRRFSIVPFWFWEEVGKPMRCLIIDHSPEVRTVIGYVCGSAS